MINLALGFGYLFSRPWPDALVPMTGVGYWLTNVMGFVLMQQANHHSPSPEETVGLLFQNFSDSELRFRLGKIPWGF